MTLPVSVDSSLFGVHLCAWEFARRSPPAIDKKNHAAFQTSARKGLPDVDAA